MCGYVSCSYKYIRVNWQKSISNRLGNINQQIRLIAFIDYLQHFVPNMTSKAVLDYLKQHNRPFSLADILRNVNAQIDKTKNTYTTKTIEKALDELLDRDEIFVKTYNKQKIFCVKQQSFNKDELREENNKIAKLTEQISSVEGKLNVAMAELREKKKNVTLEEAKEKNAYLKASIEQVKEELERLKNGCEPIPIEIQKKILESYNKSLGEYRKRKRTCMEAVNAILENYPNTKQHFLDEVGIETDESVGFDLKDYL